MYLGELCPSGLDSAMQNCKYESYIGSLTAISILGSLIIGASMLVNFTLLFKVKK